MKTEVKLVTPEWAQLVLEKNNEKNPRGIGRRTVAKYAQDMRNGKWMLTHQGIAIDEQGNLVDGQHRLAAVVEAGVAIDMLVTTDMPPSNRNGNDMTLADAVDRGRARSVGQQLHFGHGIPSAASVCSSMNQIMKLVSPGANTGSTGTILFLYDIYGAGFRALFDSNAVNTRSAFVMGPVTMYHRAEPEKAEEFLKQYETLENLSPPVIVARRWQESYHSWKSPEMSARVIANALMKFHGRESVSRLSPTDEGRQWLLTLNPTIIKRIRETIFTVPAQSGKNRSANKS